MQEEVMFEQQDFEQNKIYGILSYIPLLFLVGLLSAPNSAYTKFHVNQGIVYTICCAALSIIEGFISFFLHLILFNFMADIFVGIIGLAVGAFTIVYLILGMLNATSGAAKELPVIGKIVIYK